MNLHLFCDCKANIGTQTEESGLVCGCICMCAGEMTEHLCVHVFVCWCESVAEGSSIA